MEDTMIKYIDAEKLIKSVNNYQEWAKAESNPTYGYADYYKGKIDACKDIQEFITSLRQEQQEVNLVTEYDEQFYSDPVYGKLVNRNAGIAIARHFYELGKNAKK